MGRRSEPGTLALKVMAMENPIMNCRMRGMATCYFLLSVSKS